MQAAVIFIGAITVAVIAFLVLRSVRRRHKDAKYLPGTWLKNRWMNWDVGYHTPDAAPAQNRIVVTRADRRANAEANRMLDRQVSVRSVITLPPYRDMSDPELE